MDPIDIAREQLLSAALRYAGNHISIKSGSSSGLYDDARMELYLVQLDDAVRAYERKIRRLDG